MSDCNIINKLVVLDKDGTEKIVENTVSSTITGDIKLVGGNAFAVEQDTSAENLLIISVDGSVSADDPIYRAKWLEMINGSTAPSTDYSGLPYYIASINKALPLADNTFFLVGGLCPQLGLFGRTWEDYVRPSAIPNQLEFYDLCEACLDCGDYELLFEYTDRIEDWLDENKDDNLTTGLKLFKQYQATVHYWNYIVHAQSIPFKVYALGDDVGVKVGYRCLDCGPFDNVVIEVTAVLTSGSEPTAETWQLTGLNLEPNTLDVDVYATTSKAVVAIGSIDKNEFAIATLRYNTTVDPVGDEPGQITSTYRITATWFDTHLGASVSRFKDITVTTPPAPDLYA